MRQIKNGFKQQTEPAILLYGKGVFMKTILSLYLVLAIILAQFFAAYFFSKGRNSYRLFHRILEE